MFRKLWVIVGALALGFAGSAAAQVATPVRLVIAFPPGGPVDFVARLLADGLGKELATTVIVENKPGGNGATSAQAVINAKPDGMTLWFTSAGAAAINPSLYQKLTYKMADLEPVSLVVNNVEVLVTNANNPARSTNDLVAQSKKSKEPVPIASSGIGSMPHLAMESLASATNANFLHVPYRGAAPAIADLLGGQVSGFFGDIPGLIGQIKGGKLKPLGIAAPKRSAALPDVPTLEEQGIKGVESNNWYAVFVPAKTPQARVDQLNEAIRKVLTSEPYRTQLIESGAEPMPSTPAELAALVRDDTAKWGKLIREKNIKDE
jgi:tripartite-type tricarboxylate transporter receptor subunit TctC